MPTITPTVSTYGRPILDQSQGIGKHPATLHRWRMRGVLDSLGHRHHLKMVKCGGHWYVRDEDLAAFFAALSGLSSDHPDADEMRSPTARSRSAERAASELDSIGI